MIVAHARVCVCVGGVTVCKVPAQRGGLIAGSSCRLMRPLTGCGREEDGDPSHPHFTEMIHTEKQPRPDDYYFTHSDKISLYF